VRSNATHGFMRSGLAACACAWMACIVAGLALVSSPALLAKDKLPEVSDDGLQLQKDTKVRAVYLKPGATFDKYDRFKILDCYVEFDKDWQRDYNNEVAGLGKRVKDSDMERIKTDLSAEFKKIFTDELEKKGGYQVVDDTGPDVLILRPALVNLRINAPDLNSPDMRTTVVASAGQMTLYLELWDSATNTILARIMDPEADQAFRAEIASRVTNKAAADEILRMWADRLRKHIDAVHGK